MNLPNVAARSAPHRTASVPSEVDGASYVAPLAVGASKARTTSLPACDELLVKIRARSAKIGIIGLGYVGLPLARSFSDKGFRVLGFDVDSAKVQKLTSCQSYIGHIGASVIRDMRQRGFDATDRFERLAEADAVVICVPTPLTEAREPDLQFVIKSAHAIAAGLRWGQLIILESTTYPGTTRKVAALARASTSFSRSVRSEKTRATRHFPRPLFRKSWAVSMPRALRLRRRSTAR
jgi:hypothetical protein